VKKPFSGKMAQFSRLDLKVWTSAVAIVLVFNSCSASGRRYNGFATFQRGDQVKEIVNTNVFEEYQS
jgi:hypothetical protein